MGGHAPHGQHNASDTRFVASPGKAEGRNEAERPPALEAPPRPHNRGVRRTPPPPPPQPAPQHMNATDPPRGAQPPQGVPAEGTEQGPHTTRGSRTPTARQVGGQSGKGERMTSDAPRNGRRHPPRGRPAATPTTPSQVGGNQDRTPPPKHARQSKGPGAGHAEGHGPRGTALPAPSAGTTGGAHATSPRGGGSGHRESASAHTRKGLPEGQPDRARGTHRPRGMACQRARVRDTWTGRPATRSAEHVGRRGGNERDTTPGTGPNPPNRPRAPRTHRRGTAPAKAVEAHSATPQPPGWAAPAQAQGGPTGDKPVARARRRRRPGRPRIRGATQWVSARSHGCELMHRPGSGETGKPGKDGAPSSVNPGDSATRQEVCLQGPPTRTRWGAYHLARPGGPPGQKGV